MAPSENVAARWGNPIQVSDVSGAMVDCRNPERPSWVWAHSLGHSFNLGMGGEPYMIGGGNSVTAFANLGATYALEQLDLSQATRAEDTCVDLSITSYEELIGDPWSPLCLYLELRDQFGWTVWQDFFHHFHNELDQATVVTGPTDLERWDWFRNTMNEAAGVDVTPVLEQFFVPLP
jgi:hypothetical protein